MQDSSYRWWEICEGQDIRTRLKHIIIRHKRHGTVLELDECSTGDFRYCSNDFDPVSNVNRRGTRTPASSFRSPQVVAGLRNKTVFGRKMSSEMESWGNWVAKVVGALILITNPVQNTEHQDTEHGHTNVNLIPAGTFDCDLRIVLSVDSVVCIGETSSINLSPSCFRVSHGVAEAVEMLWDDARKLLVRLADTAKSRATQDKSDYRAAADFLGEIRRTFTSNTRMQQEEQSCASEYYRLPVRTRIAAMDAVELDSASRLRNHGLISAEEFALRAGTLRPSLLYSIPRPSF